MISIVSITRDDDEGIRRTLNSTKALLSDAGVFAELIVIDGGEEGSVAKAVVDLKHGPNTKILRQKTKGLYEAMNEGLSAATGKYVWFLNGGDECCVSWLNLKVVLDQSVADVLMFDYLYKASTTSLYRKSKTIRYIWHGLPTSHQAMLFSRSIEYSEIYYPTQFKIAADYAFCSIYKMEGAIFEVIHMPLAIFYGQGSSLRMAKRISTEAKAIQSEILKNGIFIRFVSRLLHFVSRLRRSIRERYG